MQGDAPFGGFLTSRQSQRWKVHPSTSCPSLRRSTAQRQGGEASGTTASHHGGSQAVSWGKWLRHWCCLQEPAVG